jgi:hypothetical protein
LLAHLDGVAKPNFSNALFHSRMPSRTADRYSSGTDFSTQKTIFFFGGESLSPGLNSVLPSARSSRQRLM